MLRTQDQFKFIQEHSRDFSLALLFRLTSFSRSGYYKWLKNPSFSGSSNRDKELYRLSLDVFEQSISNYIYDYNTKHIQNKCGMSPNMYRLHAA